MKLKFAKEKIMKTITTDIKVRGDKVIAYARGFLNDAAPLASGDQAVVELLLAQGVEKLTRAPALGLSLLGERLPVAAKAGEFQLLLLCRSQRLEQQRQGRFHRS